MGDDHAAFDEARQPEGRYANYFQIGHNAFEFVIEFGQLYPQHASPQLHTRIVTGPAYAKMLSHLLQDAIAQYERAFGTLPSEDT